MTRAERLMQVYAGWLKLTVRLLGQTKQQLLAFQSANYQGGFVDPNCGVTMGNILNIAGVDPYGAAYFDYISLNWNADQGQWIGAILVKGLIAGGVISITADYASIDTGTQSARVSLDPSCAPATDYALEIQFEQCRVAGTVFLKQNDIPTTLTGDNVFGDGVNLGGYGSMDCASNTITFRISLPPYAGGTSSAFNVSP